MFACSMRALLMLQKVICYHSPCSGLSLFQNFHWIEIVQFRVLNEFHCYFGNEFFVKFSFCLQCTLSKPKYLLPRRYKTLMCQSELIFVYLLFSTQGNLCKVQEWKNGCVCVFAHQHMHGNATFRTLDT